MKATGIVRRIDDLGRVVIPKEIRRTLRLHEGVPMEIFTDREGEIIVRLCVSHAMAGEASKPEYRLWLPDQTPETIRAALAKMNDASEYELRNIFSKLHKKYVDIASQKGHNVDMSYLSMGMTNDYRVAIEEGATMVRVGTAIFGTRNYSV